MSDENKAAPEIELADPALITTLLVGRQRPRKHTTRREPLGTISATRVPKSRRCQCGQCHKCIENARWDRIFNQKFADPAYYNRKPIRVGSSLGWLHP